MPKRVELSNKQYMDGVGTCCPVCHAQEGEHTTFTRDQLQAEGDFATQLVTCQACESTWNDLFKLSGFEICSYGDRSMTAADLKKIYGDETSGHPIQTYASWQEVVASGQTDHGYWEWVEATLGAHGRPYAADLEASYHPGGCKVVILSQMGPDEVDDEVGPMYKVRLPDGSVEDAFHSELTLV